MTAPTAGLRERLDDDSGVTMIEVVVSLVIMAFMMTIFTTGVIQMYSGATKTESLNTAQSELNLAFLRLDKSVRYASGISSAQQIGAFWYVGIVATNTGAQTCTALRLNTGNGELAVATWDESAPPATATWTRIASNISPPPGEPPFVRQPADAVSTFERLRLRLVAKSGTNRTATSTDTDITFTALNTTLATTSESACNRFWR